MNPYKYEIERLLRDIMNDCKVSGKELAYTCDIAHCYISRMIRGDRIPRKTIDKLCWSLDIYWGDFFAVSGFPLKSIAEPRRVKAACGKEER